MRAALRTMKSIAYLGPPGTYGEQAAKRFAARLGGDAELVPCPTIKSIYTHPASYLVLPLENTLHGVVVDTADALLSPLASPTLSAYPRIIADTSLRIAHHLVARAGVPLSAVREVRSHEQALGQSAAWLDKHLPGAKRTPWASTAGAMQSVLQSRKEEGIAAICSRVAWENEREKLELLCEATQAVKDNFTRFVLLSRADQEPLPAPSGERVEFYACPDASAVSDVVRAGKLHCVHTRPAPAGTVTQQFPVHLPRYALVEASGCADTPPRCFFLGSAVAQEPEDLGQSKTDEVPTTQHQNGSRSNALQDELNSDDDKAFIGSGAV